MAGVAALRPAQGPARYAVPWAVHRLGSDGDSAEHGCVDTAACSESHHSLHRGVADARHRWYAAGRRSACLLHTCPPVAQLARGSTSTVDHHPSSRFAAFVGPPSSPPRSQNLCGRPLAMMKAFLVLALALCATTAGAQK